MMFKRGLSFMKKTLHLVAMFEGTFEPTPVLVKDFKASDIDV